MAKIRTGLVLNRWMLAAVILVNIVIFIKLF